MKYCKRTINLRTLALSTLLCSTIGSSGVQADDVEVYMAPPAPVSPNVLFVLDESGSMNWNTAGTRNLADTDPGQRMYQLQWAMQQVLGNSDNNNINAGILAYTTRSHPTRVVHEFARIGTDGAAMRTAVGYPNIANDGLDPWSGTPSVHALAAAVQWYESSFRGEDSPIANDPEDNWCRPNYIVFMTDGQPNSNYYETDLATNVLDLNPNPDTYRNSNCTRVSGANGNGHGDSCSGEIVNWAFTTDLKTGTGWDGDQNIITHTVGMGPAADPTPLNNVDDNNEVRFMKYVATQGGGQYFPGSDAASLSAAFQTILTQAGKVIPFTYTSPTIPFDQNNAALSDDEIYVPLFEPGWHEVWYGNVKKYKVAYEQDAPTPSVPNPPLKVVIRDTNNSKVLDDNTLAFRDPIIDLWNNTGSADNADPLVGGAAAHMDGTSRNLYTWFGTEDSLAHTDNRVIKTNSALDSITVMGDLAANSDLDDAGIAADFTTRRDTLIDWLTWQAEPVLPDGNGSTVTVSHKDEMGAALHTQPAVVRHGGTDYVFIATTEGILHALNSTTGAELWSFMPDELLSTVATSFAADWHNDKPHTADGAPDPTNDHGHVTKPGVYGLDGPTLIYTTDGGRRLLVQGMRRGGNNYYALDITNPMSPTFAWEIIGGSGDFVDLAQTWSKPVHTWLEINGGSTREVLIFGGGYDDDQDDSYIDNNNDGIFNVGDTAVGRVDDDTGNAIYIVDAATGAHIRTVTDAAGVGATTVISAMKNGIPADILPVDINANGVTDRLYATDVGGRIIRVDIPDQAMISMGIPSTMKGTIVADVNGDSTTGTEFQRLFNTPEVAYFKRGGMQYLSLIIASGHRPQPLSRSVDNDRLYVIKDPNVWAPPSTYPAALTESDLYDATANDIQDGDATAKMAATTALAAADGWYIDLGTGEKGFSAAKVYDYVILFTTYTGERGVASDSCKVVNTNGSSYMYALDMRDASAVFEFLDGNAGLDGSDRKALLKIPGMPPAPDLLFPDPGTGLLGGEVVGMVGLEEVTRWPDRFHPVYWEEIIND